MVRESPGEVERLSDSLCWLGRKEKADKAVKNDAIITLLYYSLLTDLHVPTLAPCSAFSICQSERSVSSINQITILSYLKKITNAVQWHVMSLSCLIFVFLQVCQVSWSVGLYVLSALETSQAIISSNIYSLSLSLSAPPPFFFPGTPIMHMLDNFTSFHRSQRRAKDLSSGEISEICLCSTAKPSASWTLGHTSLLYSLAAPNFFFFWSLRSSLCSPVSFSMLWAISCSCATCL